MTPTEEWNDENNFFYTNFYEWSNKRFAWFGFIWHYLIAKKKIYLPRIAPQNRIHDGENEQQS